MSFIAGNIGLSQFNGGRSIEPAIGVICGLARPAPVATVTSRNFSFMEGQWFFLLLVVLPGVLSQDTTCCCRLSGELTCHWRLKSFCDLQSGQCSYPPTVKPTTAPTISPTPRPAPSVCCCLPEGVEDGCVPHVPASVCTKAKGECVLALGTQTCSTEKRRQGAAGQLVVCKGGHGTTRMTSDAIIQVLGTQEFLPTEYAAAQMSSIVIKAAMNKPDVIHIEFDPPVEWLGVNAVAWPPSTWGIWDDGIENESETTYTIEEGAGSLSLLFPYNISSYARRVAAITLKPLYVVDSFFDIQFSIAVFPTSCEPADLNGDGTVDVGDLALLLTRWGLAHLLQRADIDRDGRVEVTDLSILLVRWGDRSC